MITFTNTRKMIMESCCNCGVDFAMTEEYQEMKMDDGSGFHCPNGHRQYYTESKKQRIIELENEVKNSRARISHLQETRDHYQNRMNGYKGHATRIKNAIAKGKCPCCNNFFSDLHQHMKEKHPTFNHQEE